MLLSKLIKEPEEKLKTQWDSVYALLQKDTTPDDELETIKQRLWVEDLKSFRAATTNSKQRHQANVLENLFELALAILTCPQFKLDQGPRHD